MQIKSWIAQKNIVGLAPMDGVTDAPFRFITDKYGHPDVIFTEFVSADGLTQGRRPVYDGLIHHNTKTPIVAQLIGANPNNIYLASTKILSLGFNGIDINMGCPDRAIYKKGAGGALINNKQLARDIIKSVQQAIADSKTNKTVSVKTRLGLDSYDEDWFKNLLEAGLDAIIIHGRSVTRPFQGLVDWDSIGRIVELAKNTKTKIIGNGDVKDRQDGLVKIKKYGITGVLIGRKARGNPWVFTGHVPTLGERKKVMIEHCEKFLEMLPTHDFCSLRKHLAWYCHGFAGSAKIRNQLMQVKNISDVKNLLNF